MLELRSSTRPPQMMVPYHGICCSGGRRVESLSKLTVMASYYLNITCAMTTYLNTCRRLEHEFKKDDILESCMRWLPIRIRLLNSASREPSFLYCCPLSPPPCETPRHLQDDGIWEPSSRSTRMGEIIWLEAMPIVADDPFSPTFWSMFVCGMDALVMWGRNSQLPEHNTTLRDIERQHQRTSCWFFQIQTFVDVLYLILSCIYLFLHKTTTKTK